ncbi:MAG: hypothetical protein ACLT3F_07580 [Gemmiger formicilis]|uniref:hypothetical protein n=1 Tax=Gemmiger formicilis TaxID=745368 RepID=UPI0039911CB3
MAERAAAAALQVFAGGFLDGKLHLTSAGLHLRLGRYAPRSFICSDAQLALSLGHAANIARRGLGGDGFFFRPLAGQICPTARALRPHRAACRT